MRYHGPVIRPPSEAESYILQVTFGCSHNQCTFCGAYDDNFQPRPVDDVLEDIEMAAEHIRDVRRCFLADGNAMVLGTPRLIRILDALSVSLPLLRRTSIYANARDILTKSDAELAELKDRGLDLIYMGLESGSDEVLRRVNKQATAAEMIEAVDKAKQAGMKISVIALLGLGGPELSQEHAEATGRVVNHMDPHYLSVLTLMLVPGTALHDQWKQGSFRLLEPAEMLNELRAVLSNTAGLSRCVFRSNHASNYVPLAGTLSRDTDRLLATLEQAQSQGRAALRPEKWRGL